MQRDCALVGVGECGDVLDEQVVVDHLEVEPLVEGDPLQEVQAVSIRPDDRLQCNGFADTANDPIVQLFKRADKR